MAYSYIASIVAILMGLQSFIGLDFAPDQWTAAVTVIVGVIVAIRQIINKRSTIVGARPENF